MVQASFGRDGGVNLVNPGEKQRRIIIVEDNVLVARFFRMALERVGGYSCTITEDIPSILAEVEAGKADLI